MGTFKKILPIFALVFWLSDSGVFSQSHEAKPCNANMTFCWYGPYQDGGGEVEVWGNEWKPDDPTEKTIEQITEVRCIKRLHVCIKARNEPAGDRSYTNIDIFNVRSWNNSRVEAVLDEEQFPECEHVTMLVNRTEQSALLISVPGPLGRDIRCIKLTGGSKTVVYKLTK